jgi:hypothetical protein
MPIKSNMGIRGKVFDGSVNYLINSYDDLKDVIMTVEKLIAETHSVRNKTILRESCAMSIMPLKDKSGFVLRIKLHESIIEAMHLPSS